MNNSDASKPTWQRIIAVILALPMIFVTISYWGYSFEKLPMNFGLTAITGTLVCAISGLLAGLMFNDPTSSFSKNIVLRGLAGFITGALAIWAFGLYLWIRGYPESIHKIEIGVAGILAFLPGFLIYRFGKKD